MQKIVYVLPGYLETTKHKRYRKVIRLFRLKGFKVIRANINWKGRTMTGYVKQFVNDYKPKKDSYLFGFSFGAIIAMISAKKIRPKLMVLCSLSPYFKEDLMSTRQIFGKTLNKYFTEKDFKNLAKYSFADVVKGVKCRTIIIAGDKETVVNKKTYPIVLKRAREARRMIKNSMLIVVKNGKHDISQPPYFNEIKKIVENI